jgi:PAS domain S-box-containing protein
MENTESHVVLVISDDPLRLHFIETVLKKVGHRVISCKGAKKALAVLEKEVSPDLIVTDMQLTYIDSWRFCRLLRSPAFSNLRHVPVLAFSSDDLGGHNIDTAFFGVDGYLSAPFSPLALCFNVRRLLDQGRNKSETSILVAGTASKCGSISDLFQTEGFLVSQAATGEKARQAIEAEVPDILIIRDPLPDMSSDRLLELCVQAAPKAIIVVITKQTDKITAIRFVREGATCCLCEPLDNYKLLEFCRDATRSSFRRQIKIAGKSKSDRLPAGPEQYRAYFNDRLRGVAILETIQDSNNDSPAFRLLEVNQTFEQIVERPKDALIGRTLQEILPNIMPELPALYASVTSSDTSSPLTYTLHILNKYLEVQVCHPGMDGYILLSIFDVSDRKRQEEVLLENRSITKGIYRTAPNIIGISVNRIITEVNDRVLDILGYLPDEIIGKSTRIFYPSQHEYKIAGENLYRQIRETGRGSIETQFKHKNGAVIDIILNAVPLYPGNANERIVFILTDISCLKRIEKALQCSQEKYKKLFHEMLSGFTLLEIILDEAGKPIDAIFLEANPAFEKLTGLSRERVIGSRILEIFPITESCLIDRLGRVALTGVPDTFEEFVNEVGKYFEVKAFSSKPGKFAVILNDVTARRQSELELRESRLFLQETERITRVGGWKTCPDTDFLIWTDGIRHILDAPLDYAPGLEEGLSFFAPEYVDTVRKALKASCDKGESSCLEVEVITLKGQRVWAELRILGRIQNHGNRLVHGTLQDITERRRHAHEQFLKSLVLDQIRDHVTITDLHGEITYVNQSQVETLGLSKQEMVGKSTEVFREEPERSVTQQEIVAKTLQDGSWRGEVVNYDMSGCAHIMDCRTQIIHGPNGSPIALAGIATDITERKHMEEERAKLQEQLYHAQKMEDIGRLIGGVAHDFNNHLTAIIGCSQIIQKKLSTDSELHLFADMVCSAGEKAAVLTRSLLTFSRKQPLEKRPLDVQELIKNISKLLRRLIGEDIELEIVQCAIPLFICADSGHMEQVLMNLATNARDAMPDGGTIRISSEHRWLDQVYMNVHGWGAPGEYAVIDFTDSGGGIPAELQQRVFEPFYTSKEAGKGTGLGLSIVDGIIRQHGGHILLDSTPDHGTTFTIFLPLLGRHRHVTECSEQETFQGGTETILVCEDDPPVRRLVRLVLEDAGYKVIEAVDGQDSVDSFHRHLDRIHLVILDMVMPKKSGATVYGEICGIKPGVQVLFTSGYTPETIKRSGVFDMKLPFIPKPIVPGMLLKKVREALNGQ